MSDSDSAQRRRPPTIDLTAQEVEASRPANESESPTAAAAEAESPGQGQTSDQAAGRAPRRTVPYIVSGLIGAVVVAAAVAVLWFIGLVPPRGNQAQQAAADSSATPAPHSTKMSEIEAQLDRLRAAQPARPPGAGLPPQRQSGLPQGAGIPTAVPATRPTDMSEIEAQLDKLRAAQPARPPAGSQPPQRPSGLPQGAGIPSAVPAPRPADMSEVQARLDKLRAAAQAPSPIPESLPRVAEPDAPTKALSDAVAALTHRVDQIAASTQDLAAQAKAAAAAAADQARAAAQNKAQSGDLEEISGRIAALESAVKTLTADTARASSSADDRVARAGAAAAALAAVVERGAPFNAELAGVTALGADENAVAALTPFAASGLPSNAALSGELVKLVPRLRQASEATPKQSSLIARLEFNAQKLVRITRTDSAAAGDDPSAIVSRIETDARSGDIAGALADIARLPPEPRALAADWVKKAQAREAAIAASRQIAAEAAAALGKPAPQ